MRFPEHWIPLRDCHLSALMSVLMNCKDMLIGQRERIVKELYALTELKDAAVFQKNSTCLQRFEEQCQKVRLIESNAYFDVSLNGFSQIAKDEIDVMLGG